MIRSIAVVGNNIHAWMTATWLAKNLSPNTVNFHICTQHAASPQDGLCLGYQGFRHFLQSINIDETQFIRQTDASITLANHFVNWAGPDHEFFHATAEYGVHHIASFHHLAKRLQALNRLKRYDDYSLGATAARWEKFQPPSSTAGDIMASYDYGYQFRADLCCNLLREHFKQYERCRIYEESISSVRRGADGCIKSIVLCSGAELQSDLFIDCTGILDEAMRPRAEWTDWTDRCPAGYLQSDIAEHEHPVPSVTLQCMPDHIIKTLRSRNRSQREYFIYADSPPPFADKNLQAFKPGARTHAWTGNCIALGPALMTLPFLICSEVEATLQILTHLDRLYPHDPADCVIATEFNRLTGDYLARLRDTQTLVLNLSALQPAAQASKPITKTETRAAPTWLSPELAWKLALYRTFGKLPAYEHEPIDDVDWTNLLAGLGIWPRRDDMMLQTRSPEELLGLAQRIASLVSERAEHMPTLKQWLQQRCDNAY